MRYCVRHTLILLQNAIDFVSKQAVLLIYRAFQKIFFIIFAAKHQKKNFYND